VLWAIGAVAALLTAFYMFRLIYMTFFGAFRGTHEQEHHLHESPRSMTVPLIILATLAVVGGLIGIPKFMAFGADVNVFERWLHPTVAYRGAPMAEIQAARAALATQGAEAAPARAATGGTRARTGAGGEVLLASLREGPAPALREAPATEAGGGGAHAEEGGSEGEGGDGGGVEANAHYTPLAEWGFVFIAVMVALAGIGLARQMYINNPSMPAAFASRAGALYTLVAEKYYVDEFYELTVLRPFYGLCNLYHWIDRWIIDGAVNGVRNLTVGLSHVSNFNDRWVVDLAVNGVGAFVRGSSFILRRAQTGVVQNYAAAMVLGTFLLMGIYLIFR